MVSALHELLIELLRAEPEAARHLLLALGESFAPASAAVRVAEAGLTPAGPPEARADLVLHLVAGDRVVRGVVIEAQLRQDHRKRFAWPLYLAALHARLQCPVLLLVLTPKLKVARWAEREIQLGPGFALRPLVVGPHNHPRITLAEVDAVPAAVTLLSGLIHKHDPDPEPVLRAAAVAASRLDADHGALYHDLLAADLSAGHRQLLEAQMDLSKYTWKTDFARTHRAEGREEGRLEGRVEGEARGKADALVTILTARGIGPSASEHVRIAAEQDVGRLERWLVRALTATSAADVLADDA